MDELLRNIKKIIPKNVFQFFQPAYHLTLAFLGALLYRFPSNHINVVFVTGTKGKSSTVEILSAILEAAGKKVASAGTIRFKIGEKVVPNKYKMTMPGRFFVQRFLRQAVDAKCEYAVLEMTSEAAKQHRHKFIEPNALIFLNLSPEHIESHGGYDKYVEAKLSLATALKQSNKKSKVLIVNADDVESEKFIKTFGNGNIPFTAKDAEPYSLSEQGVTLTFEGVEIHTQLRGLFNVYNMLAAASYARSQNISIEDIKNGIESINEIAGRVQKIEAGQPFEVVVDYAHTPDSLEKLYQAFPERRKICVLGNTGGGRDTWKRPEMGRIADEYCSHIILTNEDPYDEDPKKIVDEMRAAITHTSVEIIMNRREAIHRAVSLAKQSDIVLISGKGTDPYIMEAHGTKIPWSDAEVVKDELKKIV